MCTSDYSCVSALADKQQNECHMFSSNLDVMTAEKDNGLTYLEHKECNWRKHCCYPQDGTRCLDAAYQDCQDAFEKGERNSGAVYILRPDPNWRLIRAVCQFDHESGWTVIQRRLDGTVNFYRGWNEYVDGFGEINGEYSIVLAAGQRIETFIKQGKGGLEGLYYLTRKNRKLNIYMEAHDGEFRTANYSTFYVDDASDDYRSHIAGYTGDAGDSFTLHNNRKFETYDHKTSHCPVTYQGFWLN
ncbi:angiopoietin-related protein 2-like [Watersipora subatra]|uniref:angiopoietin-related protein 2-like n=1 Tax=Watersipora subatra TaxID=2589382 RepID=UPI00355B29DE